MWNMCEKIRMTYWKNWVVMNKTERLLAGVGLSKKMKFGSVRFELSFRQLGCQVGSEQLWRELGTKDLAVQFSAARGSLALWQGWG